MKNVNHSNPLYFWIHQFHKTLNIYPQSPIGNTFFSACIEIHDNVLLKKAINLFPGNFRANKSQNSLREKGQL